MTRVPDLSLVASLWRNAGDAGWYFVTLPHEAADDIADQVDHEAEPQRGFGAVRVEVTCGSTTWRTSLFPDANARSYVLPVKQAVRRAEGLAAGDSVALRLRLVGG